MVARLTALADSADPLEDAQFNLARLRHLIGEEAPADPADMILRQGRISQEMLYAGFSVPALEQFMMMRDLLTGA